MAAISSPASTAEDATPTPAEWWLKCPTDPDLNVRVKAFAWNPSQVIKRARFEPTGRTRAVVLRGPSLGDDGTLGIHTMHSSDFAAIQALLDAGATLLLQNTLGEQWYAEVAGDVTRQQLVSDPEEIYPTLHFYEWQIPLTEVAIPT